MTPCAEDGPLGMSLAHREPNTQALYVAGVEGGLFPPRLLIHTPRGSHSARAWLGGSWSSFVVKGFLGEAVKAATVWAFISPEKRRGGEKIEGEGKRETGSEGGEGGAVPKAFGHRRPC